MALLTLGCALFSSHQPVFWAMPTIILSESAAAAYFGLINSVGQFGGLAGPYMVSYLNVRTHGFIGVCFLLSPGVIALLQHPGPDAGTRLARFAGTNPQQSRRRTTGAKACACLDFRPSLYFEGLR